MKYEYNVIVIGAGSAGLVVAAGTSSIGAKVALIEGNKMGGECLNVGCIPSKSFLKAAHLARDIGSSDKFGIKISSMEVDMKNVMDRVSKVIKHIEPHDSYERFQGLGVDVYKAYGKFIDNHTIDINGKRITGKSIVIATGSSPLVPPIHGLENVKYYTNENIFSLKRLPKHLIVLGAGPIGLELGQGFKHLGSKVTLIDKAGRIFPKDDSEVATLMEGVLKKEGINLKLSSSILKVESDGEDTLVTIESKGTKEIIKGDCLLVSLGRSANTGSLNLDKVNLDLTERKYIKTNDKLQTNIKNIYACGDVVGPYQFTHMAAYQAELVIQNALFPFKKSVKYNAVPWTTYTKPEVAHIGYTEDAAIRDNIAYRKYLIPLDANDRAVADDDLDGFFKLIVNKKNVLIGATIVGNKAGEQIPFATLAIVKKMKLKSFLSVIFSYPTEAETYKSASLSSLQESFKPWQKKVIQKLFFKKTTNS